MPILDNAKKALRSSRKKAEVNQVLRSKTRTLIKKAKLEPTEENISAAFSSIDKSVKKNLMHKNKAARLKSSLSSLKESSSKKTKSESKKKKPEKKSKTKKKASKQTKKRGSKSK